MIKQFKRLNLASRRDCITIVASCYEPLRAMTNHLKLGLKIRVGPTHKTSFEFIEEGQCRRIMLKFTNNDLSEDDNLEIKRSKRDHLHKCGPCHFAFSTQGYFAAADMTFAILVLHQIYDASKFGVWDTNNGKPYFYTDDMVGADNYRDDEVGPCIKVVTGSNQVQGRVAGKIYSVLQCVMEVGFSKIFTYKKAIDVRKVDTQKLELFYKVLSRYFVRIIWSDFDAANEYLKELGAIIYDFFDATGNIAKVSIDYSYIPVDIDFCNT